MRKVRGFRALPVLLLPLLACGDFGPTELPPGIPESTDPSTDRAALTALYEATNGGSWKNSSNWLSDAPLAQWYGVEVDASGRVAELQLEGNDLEGRIPPEIGDLHGLTGLDLGKNALTGPIPPEIGGLADLRSLVLWSNHLEGPIPPRIERLSSLRELHLSDNELTGPIPPEIGRLSRLRGLGLWSNDLEGSIPPELGDLAALTRLWLSSNDLAGPIPPGIGRLSQLQSLSLWANDLEGSIPSELGDLPALRELWLDYNDLTGPIPPELGRLSQLRALHLGHNALTGRIPPEIGRLSQLRTLALWSNGLEGPIPAELAASLPWLTELRLERNALSGPIPPSLGDLKRLEQLSLAQNDLSGPVPAELAGIFQLRALAVNGNPRLSGLLPVGLKDLEHLTTLHAGGTGLCAPADPDFRAWLGTLRAPRVPRCEDDVAPAYLTQAVQSFEFPVPLVADRPALLRVFLTATDGETEGETAGFFPPVRARFYLEDAEIHTVDIPGPGGAIPSRVEEGRLDASANVAVPAEVVQPGLELVVDVDPENTLGPDPGTAKRIPAAGRQAIDVRAVPALHLTYVPVVRPARESGEFLSRVVGLTEDDSLFAGARQWLPAADLTVAVHEVVYTSARTSTELITEIEAIRVMEGGTGYYMGGIPQYLVEELGLAGRGMLPGRASFSLVRSTTVAHELGHNMGLRHAPCGGAPGPDAAFPTRDGTIGAWGFNSSDSSLVDPGAPDLMSYCRPNWISDFSFTKAFDHRLREEGETAATSANAARTLLLWGGADSDGVPYLEPAFVVHAPPTLPRSGGPYTLTGLSVAREELFSLRFDTQEIADGDGESGFVFALPVSPAWADRLATVVLQAPGGIATLSRAGGPPAAILRDPRTGRIRAIVRDLATLDGGHDGLGTLAGAATDVEILISRGLPPANQWRR